MKVFIASLATETNTFAPFPTGRSAFAAGGVVRDASRGGSAYASPVLEVFRARTESLGGAVIESVSAFAEPGGRTVRAVYEELRDAILADLSAAGEVDMVLLALHGAMVAQGYEDCEGDLLRRVRDLAPTAVLGAELDPHCHLTAEMVGQADVLVLFKEYPHIDLAERAEELFDLCDRLRRGAISPVAALVDTRMIGFFPTFEPPMRDVVAGLRAAEAKPSVLSASLAHGFPWGDVADVGARVLVYADDAAEAAAEAAMTLADALYGEREALRPRYPGVEESLDRAMALNGRVVLGDYSDNPGGGAPGDSTFILREMLARGVTEAAVGCFHDPAVAALCADAGVGAALTLRLGGKSGPASGDPLDLIAEVMAVAHDHSQDVFGAREAMGLTVWIRSAGIDVLVSTMRAQVYGLDLFTGLGVDLQAKRLIVVKSSSHFEAAYGAIADHLWRVVSPGALSLDLASTPYTRRDGDFHPRLADPWRVRGRPEPQIFAPRRRPAAPSSATSA